MDMAAAEGGSEAPASTDTLLDFDVQVRYSLQIL